MHKLCAACNDRSPTPICPSCHDEIERLRLASGRNAVYAYEAPLKRALLAWKNGDRPDLTAYFCLSLPPVEADAVVAIPPALRAVWRGFHAPTELARATGLPVHRLALVRLRQRRQTGRDRLNRFFAGTLFAATPWARKLRGKRVLLVDDVMTTGATMAAAVDVLLRAGVSRCHVLALARVERYNEPRGP